MGYTIPNVTQNDMVFSWKKTEFQWFWLWFLMPTAGHAWGSPMVSPILGVNWEFPSEVRGTWKILEKCWNQRKMWTCDVWRSRSVKMCACPCFTVTIFKTSGRALSNGRWEKEFEGQGREVLDTLHPSLNCESWFQSLSLFLSPRMPFLWDWWTFVKIPSSKTKKSYGTCSIQPNLSSLSQEIRNRIPVAVWSWKHHGSRLFFPNEPTKKKTLAAGFHG